MLVSKFLSVETLLVTLYVLRTFEAIVVCCTVGWFQYLYIKVQFTKNDLSAFWDSAWCMSLWFSSRHPHCSVDSPNSSEDISTGLHLLSPNTRYLNISTFGVLDFSCFHPLMFSCSPFLILNSKYAETRNQKRLGEICQPGVPRARCWRRCRPWAVAASLALGAEDTGATWNGQEKGG